MILHQIYYYIHLEVLYQDIIKDFYIIYNKYIIMIKFVIFDFDGVFTNGKIYFNNNGEIQKCYNGKDSYSLKILKKNNIKTGIITADSSISLKNAFHIFKRLDKFNSGNFDKLNILDKWLEEEGLNYKNVAYIGDDIPDIPILKKVGFSSCPSDAVDEVKKICDYICKKKGGEGCVREFVEKILKNKL
jgi:3-deoxy-D-manno-octulosonate 8-phosphate phosphatase (KDO 8-P phosphatase)